MVHSDATVSVAHVLPVLVISTPFLPGIDPECTHGGFFDEQNTR